MTNRFPDNFRHQVSDAMFANAKKFIPSGVNSTARSAISGWEPHPLFVDRGEGAYLYDVDGNRYIDYLLGLGPMMLGHRPKAITDAVADFIQKRGTIFALPTEDETRLAEKMINAVPSIEKVHLTNTGTEAVLYAIRLARAYTGKSKVIRFEGMYHGFSDSVYWSKHPSLSEAGPDDSPVPVPQGPGLPKSLGESLLILPWNDAAALEEVLEREANDIAAVVTEPVMLNTGCILPEAGYLEFMREITQRHHVALIFDEVITGFRLSFAGAQGLYNIMPDLTVFAKGLGCGFPIAALGGKAEIMDLVDTGEVSMAGTYSANGIAVAAANVALDILSEPQAYDAVTQRSTDLRHGLQEIFNSVGVPARVVGIGPTLQVWFTEKPIRNYRDAARYARADHFRIWWEEMLSRGILFHPGHFENVFVSFAHSSEDVRTTLECAESAAAALKRSISTH